MAVHGKSAGVYCDEFDLSPYFNSVSKSVPIEPADYTTFSAAQDSKMFLTGLNDGTITCDGLFDGAAGAIDSYLTLIFNNPVDRVVTVSPQGAAAINQPVWMAQAILSNWEVAAPVADVVSTNAEFQADGGVTNGVMLLQMNPWTAGPWISAGLDTTITSTLGGVGHLHVAANTAVGTVTPIRIQHSPDNSAWADLVVFSTVPAATRMAQRVAVAGTVNRWLRINMVVNAGAGAATLTMSFARR